MNKWGLFGGALGVLVNLAVGGFAVYFAALAFGFEVNRAGALAVVGVVLAAAGIAAGVMAVIDGTRGRPAATWLGACFIAAAFAALTVISVLGS